MQSAVSPILVFGCAHFWALGGTAGREGGIFTKEKRGKGEVLKRPCEIQVAGTENKLDQICIFATILRKGSYDM